jgi:hypothetical protein
MIAKEAWRYAKMARPLGDGFPLRVKTGKAQCEHMFSALPLRADIAHCVRHVRFVPPAADIADGKLNGAVPNYCFSRQYHGE